MQREKAPPFQMKPLEHPALSIIVSPFLFFLLVYPTLCRLSSRILSAIIAMNSLFVGLPRRLWMV